MTATGTVGAAAIGAPAPARPARSLRPTKATWPLWAMTVGMPFAYLVGVHAFMWTLPGLVFGARILADRKTRFPRSTIPLALFLLWIPLSTSMLSSAGGLPVFVYRWFLFAGILTTMVWITNVPEKVMSTAKIVDWLGTMWIIMIGFGILGIIFLHFNQKSPLQLALGPLGNNGFIDELSRWRFAETQGWLGYPVPRPAAPFPAANGWGSAMGILTPFFLQSWIIDADRRRRKIGIIVGAIGVYPIVVSVNRGLWVSLAVALAYFAAHKALRGKFGAFVVLVGALVAVVGILALTPAGTLVSDRLANSENSNESRSTLYVAAYAGAKASPLVGWGQTIKLAGASEGLPGVGTHGLLWYLMFVHGFVALVLFVAWLGWEVLRSGNIRTKRAWWAHLALVIGLVEMPFYGLLPQVVLLGIAAGIAHREDPA